MIRQDIIDVIGKEYLIYTISSEHNEFCYDVEFKIWLNGT